VESSRYCIDQNNEQSLIEDEDSNNTSLEIIGSEIIQDQKLKFENGV
jgi:hypothetical protein